MLEFVDVSNGSRSNTSTGFFNIKQRNLPAGFSTPARQHWHISNSSMMVYDPEADTVNDSASSQGKQGATEQWLRMAICIYSSIDYLKCAEV